LRWFACRQDGLAQGFGIELLFIEGLLKRLDRFGSQRLLALKLFEKFGENRSDRRGQNLHPAFPDCNHIEYRDKALPLDGTTFCGGDKSRSLSLDRSDGGLRSALTTGAFIGGSVSGSHPSSFTG
jgi:hypothetical protein